MEDFEKVGWMIFNFIVFGIWVSIWYYIGQYFKEVIFENNFLLIVFFIVQWFGGIFFVIYFQDYISNLFRKNN
jgi:membrane protein DedA with SNARE-associated domain